MTNGLRKIIHVDMDCFYAAVEARDNPALRNKPIAVGGAADRRGVLTTCNYVARRFGLHSAMASARALQLCPRLVLLPVDMAKYRAVSAAIHKIFQRYTTLIEPLSLDEAYLDVSDSKEYQGSATLLAQRIRTDITRELKLTASAGIAPNKFLAKVASDWRKPNGQFCIPPQRVTTFVKSLSVEKIPGVGRVNAEKLHGRGITTCAQLQTVALLVLQRHFGKFGERLYQYCRGIDDRSVQPLRRRKSLSVERTFMTDLCTLAQCEAQLPSLYSNLCRRLVPYQDHSIHKQWVKIKFSDFSLTTKECRVSHLQEVRFIGLMRALFTERSKKIRLLGLGVRFNDTELDSARQSSLFVSSRVDQCELKR